VFKENVSTLMATPQIMNKMVKSYWKVSAVEKLFLPEIPPEKEFPTPFSVEKMIRFPTDTEFMVDTLAQIHFIFILYLRIWVPGFCCTP